MNFQGIRVRYGALFYGVAIFFILAVVYSVSLTSSAERSVTLFGQQFNPAISAVLNADRDLYQARVSELQALLNPASVTALKAEFIREAQQAYQRMAKYKVLMQAYPEVLVKLESFDVAFERWRDSVLVVFEHVEQGQLERAQHVSESQVQAVFMRLRRFYDMAGEMADHTSVATSEAAIAAMSQGQTLLVLISLLVVSSALSAGYLAPRAMSNALLQLSAQLQAVSRGGGDLSRRIRSERKDEVGQVAHDLDHLLDAWSDLIGGIVNQSSGVISGVQGLNDGALQVKQASLLQAEKVHVIATAVSEMSDAVKEVSGYASQTSNNIAEVNRLTEDGAHITRDAVEQIAQLSRAVENAQEVISHLAARSADIASVLDVIRGVAEQTNLLALNAAIEAARAGEQGRGFAVVADEVRTLASRTQESTDSIQEMIQTLHIGVQQAVDSIAQGSAATAAVVGLSQQTLLALDDIAQASGRVSEMALQTATATEEQSQVANDIRENLAILSRETQANTSVAEANGEQADEVMQLATELSGSVTRFKLG